MNGKPFDKLRTQLRIMNDEVKKDPLRQMATLFNSPFTIHHLPFTILFALLLTACTIEPPPPPTATPHPVVMNTPVEALPKGGYTCNDYPCPDDAEGWESRIKVPPGFSVNHFAVVPDKPTSMTFGPDGLLYIAGIDGNLFTVDDAGSVTTVTDEFFFPVGIAFQSGTNKLYVSDRVSMEEARVGLYNISSGRYTKLVDGIPCCYASMHAANGLEFGPDNKLYVAVGAVADHGEVLNTDQKAELHPWEASILRMDPDGENIEPYARGLRNAFDIAWDTQGRLYATNNGPDYGPPDTIYLVEEGGEHGYPYYECDNCFGMPTDGTELVPPIGEFIPHSAPTGVAVYPDDTIPGYKDNVFAVLWSAFEGAQKVVRFAPEGAESVDWATGFAAPIDITVVPDGAFYVAGFETGVIYQIVYDG